MLVVQPLSLEAEIVVLPLLHPVYVVVEVHRFLQLLHSSGLVEAELPESRLHRVQLPLSLSLHQLGLELVAGALALHGLDELGLFLRAQVGIWKHC